LATFRKRGKRWQVQVRRKGRTPISCSFQSKSAALAWGREQELEADQRRAQVHKTLKGITVADIVGRYRDEVVPRKRGADRETLTLNAFLRHPLAQVALGDVTTGMVSAYCAGRLHRMKPGTLNREHDILRHAFAVARRNWDIPIVHNAFADVVRPASWLKRRSTGPAAMSDLVLQPSVIGGAATTCLALAFGVFGGRIGPAHVIMTTICEY
jgi:hypothetical protein